MLLPHGIQWILWITISHPLQVSFRISIHNIRLPTLPLSVLILWWTVGASVDIGTYSTWQEKLSIHCIELPIKNAFGCHGWKKISYSTIHQNNNGHSFNGEILLEVGREEESYGSCSAVLYVPDIKLEHQATAKMLKDT